MGRRKKEPLNVHRDNITLAATTLFTEKGVAETTMDEISKAAGYSKATLYVYFENKEEIFFSLVYHHMKNLYTTIEKFATHKANSQKEWIENYINICFSIQALCKEHPLYFEGIIGKINVDIDADKTPQIYKDIYHLGMRLTETIKIIIGHGIELGFFTSDVNADAISIFLWSNLSGIIRMAECKKDYYKLLGFDNDNFLKCEFLALLDGCKIIQEVNDEK